MQVAADSAIDYGVGKLFGLALKGMGRVSQSLLKRGRSFVEQHHVIPRFLGGDPSGRLADLAADAHRGKGSSYHNILRKKLKELFGDKMGVSTRDWEELLKDPVNKLKAHTALIDAAGEFDNLYGGDILSTATVTELIDQFY